MLRASVICLIVAVIACGAETALSETAKVSVVAENGDPSVQGQQSDLQTRVENLEIELGKHQGAISILFSRVTEAEERLRSSQSDIDTCLFAVTSGVRNHVHEPQFAKDSQIDQMGTTLPSPAGLKVDRSSLGFGALLVPGVSPDDLDDLLSLCDALLYN